MRPILPAALSTPSSGTVNQMPRDEYERLLPNLEQVRLPRNRILYETGDEVRSAYFLSEGMVSFLAHH